MDPGPLRVGVCTVDITPADLRQTYLAGFGLGRKAKEVLEPIEAGALYLSDDTTDLVLVTLDLIGLTRHDAGRVRKRVTAMKETERVICCSTHTHSGPDTLGLWGPSIMGVIPRATGINPDYMRDLHTKAAFAVDEAKHRAEPAILKAATFDVPADWTRNDRVGGGRYDRAVVLGFESPDGAPICTLLNYASHPETLWEHNPYLSPDFPGSFRRRVRNIVGGEALYFSGPLGGMLTPNVAPKADLETRKDYALRMGTDLANLCVSALKEAAKVRATPVGHTIRRVGLKNANWRFRLGYRLGLLRHAAKASVGAVTTEVHRVDLGEVQLLTVPGEPVPELGHVIHDRMSGEHRLICALGGDELGYILLPEMFENKEYKYETTMSLGRHVAPALLDAYDEILSEDL